MKIQVQLTEDDLVTSRWLAMRPRRWLQVVGWMVLLTLAFAMGVAVNEAVRGRGFPVELWWEMGSILYLFVWFWVLMPARIRKTFSQQKSLQRPFTLEFDETQMSVVSENGSMTFAWADFIKWKKNRKMILLYQSDAVAHLIPLRAFPTAADLRQLEELLRSKLGEEKA